MPVKLSEVKDIIVAAFPEWKGRKVRMTVHPTVTFHDLHWNGGTWSEYALVVLDVEQNRVARADFTSVPAWDNPAEGAVLPLRVGTLVVQHQYFCGRDAGCTIHCHPDGLAQFLPAAS